MLFPHPHAAGYERSSHSERLVKQVLATSHLSTNHQSQQGTFLDFFEQNLRKRLPAGGCTQTWKICTPSTDSSRSKIKLIAQKSKLLSSSLESTCRLTTLLLLVLKESQRDLNSDKIDEVGQALDPHCEHHSADLDPTPSPDKVGEVDQEI